MIASVIASIRPPTTCLIRAGDKWSCIIDKTKIPMGRNPIRPTAGQKSSRGRIESRKDHTPQPFCGIVATSSAVWATGIG